ncbi:MAG: LysM peptidoglycan-binding domain-containing protein [Thalassolituus oleivorans]|nr:LysM peptidoglycan-binding domain-containing protein [Thalassolituus oleivorans]
MSRKLLILTVLFLVGCQGAGTIESAPETNVAQQTATPQFIADPTLSTDERLREVFHQLELGEVGQAEAELDAYLVEKPEGKVAADLKRQIDLGSSEYYPAESFDVTLMSGQSLSTLAQKYLGTAYQFYALAKYNGIARPNDLKAGQVVRIPLTDFARQALENLRAVETEPVQVSDVESDIEGTADTAVAEELPVLEVQDLEATADEYHKQASMAFRRQELDQAIALWDKVLEIDPSHQHAMSGRLQAMELRKKLLDLQ